MSDTPSDETATTESTDAPDAAEASGGTPPADAQPAADDGAKPEAPEGRDASFSETPLAVENLRKSFGGLTAVYGLSFEIEAGTLTGLIGPNGAGKSTTFNLITCFLDPDGGTVRFRGDDVTGKEPNELAERGLVRTFQIARELEDMTVLENMMLAPKHQRGESLVRSVSPLTRGSVQTDEEAVLEDSWEMLDFFDIEHLAHEYAGSLSGGQRKLLEMARALMTDPDMLLLDEPFAGVNPSLEKRLLKHIHELREQGYTFLLVEHDIDLIMENCERVLVMHQGRLLADGDPEDVKDDERVIEAYLGGDV